MEGPYGATVTGTANVMSAAVLARGRTTIIGAALEPEIVDLGRFLNQAGARIEGLGTPELRITGVSQLHGLSYQVIPDRIEAATLLLAAAITRGSLSLEGVIPGHLTGVLEALRQTGSVVYSADDRVTLDASARPRPATIVARPYPGIPTDLQAQWMVLLSLASGRSTVTDTVFPGRFLHVDELRRLGAEIHLEGSTAIVHGVRRLSGASVTASDLRASAALVLAGLAAEGVTTVLKVHHLDRGYECLQQKLGALGASFGRDLAPHPRVRSAIRGLNSVEM
jgi:UDP-N-acetylglucosamine 1-carboxyvinyltransferase